MTQMPKGVSIIIPCYNGKKTLERCLRSIIEQTYDNIEICFIDNNSTDTSLALAQDLLAQTERPSQVLQVYDKGVSYARNAGITAAQGRYICFLDCDDWLPPTSIALRVAHLDAQNCGMVYGSYLRMYSNGIQKKITPPQQLSVTTLYKKNHVPNLTGMYDTLKCAKVLQAPIGHEDYDMWLNVISQTNGAQTVADEVLGYYQVSTGSLSSNKVKAAIWYYRIMSKHVSKPLTRAWYFLNYVYHGVRR